MENITASPNHPKFVRWAIMLGIVIVLNVFFAVLVRLVLPTPEYETYCPTSQVVPAYDTQDACTAIGGQWTNVPPAPEGQTAPFKGPAVTGYCDAQYTCRQQFTDANEVHAKNAFIAYVVLGVIALVAGVLPIGSSIVSSGLSYGGVVTLIVGSAQYWGTANNWIRLAISLVALLALLYIGWKRFRD
jgi:hypothetical protein